MSERILTNKTLKNEIMSGHATSPSSWQSWCRLCAKKGEAGQENSMIFSNDLNSSLTTSIGKFFWVNIKPEDEIPKKLCRECQQLIDELVGFTERINKVQTMYCIMQNVQPTSMDAANKLRSQFGVVDENWEHIIKAESTPPPKPDVADRGTQTDLVIFFNNHSQEEKKDNVNVHVLTNEDSDELTKKQASHEDEYEINNDPEQEQTYEYILNDDNEEGEVDTISYTEEDIKLKLSAESAQADEDADIEDSDLFKELKFKAEENDEESGKKVISNDKQIRLEVDQMVNNSESTEVLDGEPTEVDGEADYLELLEYKTENDTSDRVFNEFDSTTKRKRGRPSLKQRESSYRYDCPDCQRKYKNPTIYRKHMLTKHGVTVGPLPDFICSVCGNDCSNQSALKRHMRKHLPDEEKYNIACPYCDKKFSQEGAMKQHVNGIHHQMKPYICDQCGRACKTLSALHEHQLVHTNECPFTCEVCQKGFKNKARLKSHMDTHTDREYSCPDCNLKLNTKRTLLQHRLVHTNVKRFKCQFCDAAFKRSKAFKSHLILHSGLRPYKCPFCDKSFSNGSNCRSHKKRAHPKELAQEEALGIKSKPTHVPKLEDLKAAKGIVQPRQKKWSAGPMADDFRKRKTERFKKEAGEDSDNISADENCEFTDIQYEFEEELDEDDDEDMEGGSLDLADDCEETVIYEIIGEV